MMSKCFKATQMLVNIRRKLIAVLQQAPRNSSKLKGVIQMAVNKKIHC